MEKSLKLLKIFSSIIFANLALGLIAFIYGIVKAIGSPETIGETETTVFLVLKIISFILVVVMSIGVFFSAISLITNDKQNECEGRIAAIIGLIASSILIVMGIISFFGIPHWLTIFTGVFAFASWVMMIVCFSMTTKSYAKMNKSKEPSPVLPNPQGV